MHRQILENAISHTCGDRDLSYGSPVENMQNTADLWTAYLTGKYTGSALDPRQFVLSGEDVAFMLALVKMARTFSGKVKADTYEDAAAYAAIAGECAEAAAPELEECPCEFCIAYRSANQ